MDLKEKLFKLCSSFGYKRYFTLLMFITEGMACINIVFMFLFREFLAAIILCGFIALIFTVITMGLHILVRIEETREWMAAENIQNSAKKMA
ncbi:MAG: hypothetical protein NZ952_03360 [Candidatus Bathyarchaeota archaeon]|nr:hypothetical protein [Candidatus Bathyarchaeota archaeon]